MSARFHKLKVIQVIHETPDAYSIYFQKPEGKTFDYKPGQYLILNVDVEGTHLRRAFSLSTSPYLHKHLSVTIKCITKGQVSNYLQKNLKVGDELDVMPPMGNFTVDIDPVKSHHYVLIGGGSGITPLKSILLSVLSQEPKSKVSLVYANRDLDSVIFKKELDKLSIDYNNRFDLFYSLDVPPENWKGIKGQLNANKIKEFINTVTNYDLNNTSFYICGPAGLMELVNQSLSELNITNENIHKEHFTAKLPEAQSTEKKAELTELENIDETAGIINKVKVILDGKEHFITVQKGVSILQAAIDAGIDPPYACQEGICTTCRAKLHSGEVKMDEDEGLTDDEIEEGYILTCQSHPVKPNVVVEYE